MTRDAGEDMEGRVAAYLAHCEPGASDILVDEFARIPGGASQETFRFRARWRAEGGAVERKLILRRLPAVGMVVIESDLEYTVYRALEGQGVPVPGVHYREADPAWLDRPFFIMDMAPGRPGIPYLPTETYDGREADVIRQFWRHLGTLAALDHRELGLTGLRNGGANDGFWRGELDHWEAILHQNERVVDPISRGAIRWMRRNPPPEPPKPAIVHGDYRSGNFLFTPDGAITAILDWEMAHIGDPHEDIAWGINQAWQLARHLPLEQGYAIWEEASGMKLDRAALDWWKLFTTIKSSAIWLSAEESVFDGRNRELTVVLTPLRTGPMHRKETLTLMAERGAMG